MWVHIKYLNESYNNECLQHISSISSSISHNRRTINLCEGQEKL